VDERRSTRLEGVRTNYRQLCMFYFGRVRFSVASIEARRLLEAGHIIMRARSAVLLALAAAPFAIVVACSSPDPGGHIPRAYQPPLGATPGASTPNAPPSEPGTVPTHPPPSPNPGPSPTPTTTPTTTPSQDAGAPPPAHDAGAPPPAHDAGGNPNAGPPGSCSNPLCGTDPGQGYCGCTATDANGNQVQLGCQPGGQCGCFVNQNLVDNTVQDENGLCGAGATAQQQFFAQTCTCN
jgi:hypothetical protein